MTIFLTNKVISYKIDDSYNIYGCVLLSGISVQIFLTFCKPAVV